MNDLDTKTRILDAAERLFAEQGFAATTLRNITSDAGVNLAAVHYHFNNKEGLLTAVLKRCIDPINMDRLRLLDDLEAKAGEAGPGIEDLLRALLGPAIRHFGVEGKPRRFLQLFGRVHTEPDETMMMHFEELFTEIKERFFPALNRALPELPVEEVFWRTHFVIGSMAHTLVWCRNIANTDDFPHPLPQADVLLEKLVKFSLAGMTAPYHDAAGGTMEEKS